MERAVGRSNGARGGGAVAMPTAWSTTILARHRTNVDEAGASTGPLPQKRSTMGCGADLTVTLFNSLGVNRRKVKGSDVLSRGSVQVGGESIYYEAAGMAENRPTILFLHESGGTSATWHGQLVGLAQQARCIVPDLPGHGRSEGVGHSQVSEYSRAVLSFLDALAIRWPVVVAGVCLGAAVAVDLALNAPERVAGLVLCGVSPSGRACEETRSAASRGEGRETFVRGLFGPGASERLLNENMRRWRLTGPIARFGALNAVHTYPIVDTLRRLIHPALIVSGQQDSIATPELICQLADEMAEAEVETLPRAGCMVMQEQSAQFNRIVGAFLDRVRPAVPNPVVPELRHVGGYRRF